MTVTMMERPPWAQGDPGPRERVYVRIDRQGVRTYSGPFTQRRAKLTAHQARQAEPTATVVSVPVAQASPDVHRWAAAAKAGQPYRPEVGS